MDVLRTELDFFEKHRKEWFENHAGKFSLVKGTTLHDFYDTYENALKTGYLIWGPVSFLVKEVQLVDPIIFMPNLLIGEVFDDEHKAV